MQADKPSSQLGLVVSTSSRYRKLSFKCYRSRCSPVAHHPLNEDQKPRSRHVRLRLRYEGQPGLWIDISPASVSTTFHGGASDSQLLKSFQ
jgi:hypothetical protein